MNYRKTSKNLYLQKEIISGNTLCNLTCNFRTASCKEILCSDNSKPTGLVFLFHTKLPRPILFETLHASSSLIDEIQQYIRLLHEILQAGSMDTPCNNITDIERNTLVRLYISSPFSVELSKYFIVP